jgi:hypothetical protein
MDILKSLIEIILISTGSGITIFVILSIIANIYKEYTEDK